MRLDRCKSSFHCVLKKSQKKKIFEPVLLSFGATLKLWNKGKSKPKCEDHCFPCLRKSKLSQKSKVDCIEKDSNDLLQIVWAKKTKRKQIIQNVLSSRFVGLVQTSSCPSSVTPWGWGLTSRYGLKCQTTQCWLSWLCSRWLTMREVAGDEVRWCPTIVLYLILKVKVKSLKTRNWYRGQEIVISSPVPC